MPTYEYHCDACSGEFEVEKRMSDPVEAACPACGSPDTRRLISHSSFVLKGSGWYVTDYARKNGGNGGGGPAKAHGNGGNGGNGKKDEAPAAAKAGDGATPATAPAATPAASPSSTGPASTPSASS